MTIDKRALVVVAVVLAGLFLWRAVTFTVTHHCVRWEGSSCAWYQRDDGRSWTDGDTAAKGRWGWFYDLVHRNPEAPPGDPGDCDPRYGSC
jgi:hypothetical protein